MKIILHNPSHNGDQLHTLGIVKKLINDNLDKEFIIVPACSSYLFNELLSDKVVFDEHPVLWNNDKNIYNHKNFISENHNTLWNIHECNIYINMWKLLTHNNYNWISLVNRPEYILTMLKEINNKTGIKINFNCDNYKELIPSLPYVDIEFIREKIISYNKKVIFFYNLNSYSGLESSYPDNINETIIKNLIERYVENHIIVLPKKCNIIHKDLIDIETEFGVVPTLDGKNLIIYANIANICDEVYFKNNGGSLFILNQMNIKNSNNTKYNLIGSHDYYDTISNEYGLYVKSYI
jgi:hypothetical protein